MEFSLNEQVLEIMEKMLEQDQLLVSSTQEVLPSTSSASWFLGFLGLQLSTKPKPGQILR